MQIDKVQGNMYGNGLHLDVYFKLTRTEVDTLTDPAVEAYIVAQLTASGQGAVAVPFVVQRFDQIKANNGPNGCSIKMTVVNGTDLQEFLTDPI
jgi:hypothetical protein